MPIPPGQNPFFLSPSQYPAQPIPHYQSQNQANPQPALSAQASVNPAPNHHHPFQNPGVRISPHPSIHQRRAHPRNAANASHTSLGGSWGSWARPIGDSGARLPWRHMQPGDPMPRPPTFSEQIGRMNRNYRYPFPPPQEPRKVPKKWAKRYGRKPATGKSSGRHGSQGQGWLLDGHSRGRWNEGGRPGRRIRSPSFSSESELNMYGSWGWPKKPPKKKSRKKSQCVVM